MPDLPEISQNLDDPLPQVDPNSALVPYRMARTDPGQAPVVTTGYGPRARPPVQPPEGFGGGAGMPNLDQIYQAAFSKLPVEQAVKAVEAATRYVAQRSYQRDLQSGADPIQTFAKYAPLMFRQATGVPEAFQAQMQRARMNAPTIHPAGGGLYRVPATGPAETLVPPKAVAPKLHFNNTTGEVVQENPDGTLTTVKQGTPRPDPAKQEALKDAYRELDEARKAADKLVPADQAKKQDDKDKWFAAQNKIVTARKRIEKLGATVPVVAPTTPPNPAAPQQPKTLTKEIAAKFKAQAGGDLEKARKLARDAGYQF